MTKQLQLTGLTVALLVFSSGCMNMPTPPSQITGSYTSGLKYESFDCSQLSVELDSLARRENQLVTAQEQRRKTSEMQAFWWGFGQGDGIEASELANVRGEKEAVRKAMEAKNCYSLAKPGTKSQVDASGRKILGYRVDTSRKDASGDFVTIPVYEDEPKK
jgi:hypothetical protein